MMKLSKFFTFLAAVAMMLSACDKELDDKTQLIFTGDSLIALWDLQSYFSSFATTNKGLSGAHIEYLEEQAGTMTGRNVVIMIGTNNFYLFPDETSRKEYEQRYVAAIDALGADKVYLYEVLPREFETDDISINDYIRLFNSEIFSMVKDREDIIYMKVFDTFIADGNHIRRQYYFDGLHLNSLGYEILASVLFNHL